MQGINANIVSLDHTTNNFGDFTLDNGLVIHLTQDAYVSNYGTDGGVRYYAAGTDDEGNDYQVAWDTNAAWDAEQEAYRNDPDYVSSLDESDACDWADPASISLL